MRSVLNERGAALDAVDFVALLEQQLGEVGAVLAGDAGDECDLLCRASWLMAVAEVRCVKRRRASAA